MKAEISLTERCGEGSSVVLDGHDVAKGIRSLTLTATAGQPPQLTLCPAYSSMTFQGEVLVDVTPESRAALVAVGWTPPAEQVPPTEGEPHE